MLHHRNQVAKTIIRDFLKTSNNWKITVRCLDFTGWKLWDSPTGFSRFRHDRPNWAICLLLNSKLLIKIQYPQLPEYSRPPPPTEGPPDLPLWTALSTTGKPGINEGRFGCKSVWRVPASRVGIGVLWVLKEIGSRGVVVVGRGRVEGGDGGVGGGVSQAGNWWKLVLTNFWIYLSFILVKKLSIYFNV